MTTAATHKLRAYAALGVLGLVAGLALGRVEPVVLAVPFVLVLAAGLPLTNRPELGLRFAFDRERVLEGDEVPARIEVATEAPVERLEILLDLPHGLEADRKENPVAVRLRAEESCTLEVGIRCVRWGAHRPGQIVVRAHDPLGLVVHEGRFDHRLPLRVYPRPETLRDLLRPLDTQVFTGNQVARAKGEGIEFADVRQFVPGDRIRRVNWRASARRGELWVNEAHPERNADVVLFLDTFGEVRRGERGTLDLTVRAAASLAERYLREKDRVGVVTFGGTMNWLFPGSGLVQLYRVVDALLESEVAFSYAWKEIDMIPRRVLPPQALVVALTPLLDTRAIEALIDLRARRFDLAVVDVSPVGFVAPGSRPLDPLAHRIWQLRREAVRARFLALGVPVAPWVDGEPFALPLSEVTSFRRAAGPARV